MLAEAPAEVADAVERRQPSSVRRPPRQSGALPAPAALPSVVAAPARAVVAVAVAAAGGCTAVGEALPEALPEVDAPHEAAAEPCVEWT